MAASFLSSCQLEEFQKNGMLVIEDFVNQNQHALSVLKHYQDQKGNFVSEVYSPFPKVFFQNFPI